MAFPYNVSWIDRTNGFPKLFPAERKVILKMLFCDFSAWQGWRCFRGGKDRDVKALREGCQ